MIIVVPKSSQTWVNTVLSKLNRKRWCYDVIIVFVVGLHFCLHIHTWSSHAGRTMSRFLLGAVPFFLGVSLWAATPCLCTITCWCVGLKIDRCSGFDNFLCTKHGWIFKVRFGSRAGQSRAASCSWQGGVQQTSCTSYTICERNCSWVWFWS